VEYSDLVNGYRQLTKEPIDSSLSEDYTERVLTVHETAWLNILLIQSRTHADLVRLVVEVSFPDWLYGAPLLFNNDEKLNETSPILQNVLKELLSHLEYLQRLSDRGFRLALLVEEGIWTASTIIREPPSKELFTVLDPPQVNN
jgi:hypothetical protein